jgi:phosphohistidine phosphatase
MELYFLRHATAYSREAPDCPPDPERPLVEEGMKEARHAARAMRRLKVEIDRILSSPYLRAWGTAEIVAGALNLTERLERCEALSAGRAPEAVIQAIQNLRPGDRSFLLIGHEPDLSAIISLLLSGDAGLSIRLKKAGLCKLSVEKLVPGRCATLEWLLTPKQLTRIS